MDEFDWISRYLAPLAKSPKALGLGDDVAALPAGSGIRLVTQDALVESVHFLQGTALCDVAAKLVAVNASDIRSKGGACDDALLTLGIPEGSKESDLADFAAGLGEALDAVDAALIGGDTVTSSAGLFASLTMIGHCLGAAPILRSGASNGEDVWVSGEIGHGIIGLRDAKAGRQTFSTRHYLRPVITTGAVAQIVADHASAAMDVSDGLLADALKLARASQVGIEIDLERVPLAEKDAGQASVLKQVTGGDDYQTLFTARSTQREILTGLAQEEKLSRIGRVTDSPGLRLLRGETPVKLPPKLGFSHGD